MSRSFGEDSKAFRKIQTIRKEHEACNTAQDDEAVVDGEVAASISIPSNEDEVEVRDPSTAEIPEDRAEIRKRIINLRFLPWLR